MSRKKRSGGLRRLAYAIRDRRSQIKALLVAAGVPPQHAFQVLTDVIRSVPVATWKNCPDPGNLFLNLLANHLLDMRLATLEVSVYRAKGIQ